MPTVRSRLSAFRRDDSGATAIEYGLIAALIAVAAIAGMNNFADALAGMWNYVADTMENETAG